MGLTFKENVSDIRNTKVVDLIRELMSYSINVHITDPYASPNEVAHEYGLNMADQISENYDAVIVAVKHEEYLNKTASYFKEIMNGDPILFDLKGIYPNSFKDQFIYWRL